MNSTFKVVFNKARGALMVVNEVTSSVQAKGTKTVIATAVTALMAGSALAASVIPEVPSDVTVTTANTAWDKVQADGQYHYTNNGGQSAFTTLTKEKGAFAGKLWVSASGKSADATGLEVTGEGVELTNNGEIYVTTDKDGVEWRNEAMLAEDNAKAVNAGKLKVKAADGTTTLNIDSGSDVTLADRQGSVYESVNIADGKLTASIWHDTNKYGENKEQLQNDNKFKNVTVGEKGVFNITKLNSGGDKDQTKTNAKPHNTLLIKDMNLTLEGGDLQVAGKTYTDKIVIGTSNTQDSLMIKSGSMYSLT